MVTRNSNRAIAIAIREQRQVAIFTQDGHVTILGVQP
jgi:hypothetical protein